MDIVLTEINVSLLMDLMNFAKITRKTAFTRQNNALFSSEMGTVPMEIGATFCIKRKISIMLRELRK